MNLLDQKEKHLIIMSQNSDYYLVQAQKDTINFEDSMKYIDQYEEYIKQNILKYKNISTEMTQLNKKISQIQQKLHKLIIHHEQFLQKLCSNQESLKQKSKKQNLNEDPQNEINDSLDQEEDNNIFTQNHYRSEAQKIIENYEEFQLKTQNNGEDFIFSIVNPFKIDNKIMQQFYLKQMEIKDAICFGKGIIYSKCKQIKYINSLIQNCCLTTIFLPYLNLKIIYENKDSNKKKGHDEKNRNDSDNCEDDDELNIDQTHHIDLTMINTNTLYLNVFERDIEDAYDQIKIFIKFLIPDRYIKLCINRNQTIFDKSQSAIDKLCEFLENQIKFCDQNNKRLQYSFAPNFINDDFLLVISKSSISEFAIDKILFDDEILLKITLFQKININEYLFNSLYMIMYDLYLD